MPKTLLLLLAILSLAASPCGYRRAGTGESLPEHIHSIAVPAFQNASLRYKVEQRFTQAVMEEILKRGRRLTVTSEPQSADAVLNGNIKGFSVAGVLLDDSGRTRVFQITITVGVTLRDQKTQQVLFDQSNFTFRGEYELAEDPASLFNEEDPAVDRIAREFAQSLVSTILEGL
ncbi:MAG: LptE family protein [Acidobacteria bacterium]|nr:LptE family protein [Acidobacteriota bacterium]